MHFGAIWPTPECSHLLPESSQPHLVRLPRVVRARVGEAVHELHLHLGRRRPHRRDHRRQPVGVLPPRGAAGEPRALVGERGGLKVGEGGRDRVAQRCGGGRQRAALLVARPCRRCVCTTAAIAGRSGSRPRGGCFVVRITERARQLRPERLQRVDVCADGAHLVSQADAACRQCCARVQDVIYTSLYFLHPCQRLRQRCWAGH
jgi:hypothetical protein